MTNRTKLLLGATAGVLLLCAWAAGNIYYETLPGLVVKHPVTGVTTLTINGTNGNVNSSGTINGWTVDGSGNPSTTGTASSLLISYQTNRNRIFVYEGDSITDTAADTNNWPNKLVAIDQMAATSYQNNASHTGDMASAMVGEYATQVAPYKPTNSNQQAYFFLLAGSNDFAAGRTPAQCYADLTNLWGMARGDGFKVVAFCCTRSTVSLRDTNSVNCNVLIVANPSLYDYLIRTDLVLPSASNTNLFYDGIHPTSLGSTLIAKAVIDALQNQDNNTNHVDISRGNTVVGAGTGTAIAKQIFRANGSPLLTVLDNGYMGIGTVTNPFGALMLPSNLGSLVTGLNFEDTYGDSNARRWGMGCDFYNWGDFGIGSGTTQGGQINTIRFLIKNSGFTGINTNAPTEMLEVQGNAKVSGSLKLGTNVLSFDGSNNLFWNGKQVTVAP